MATWPEFRVRPGQPASCVGQRNGRLDLIPMGGHATITKSFWCHFGPFGALLGPFWAHFGSFWDHLGTFLGQSWDRLEPFWDHLGASWDLSAASLAPASFPPHRRHRELTDASWNKIGRTGVLYRRRWQTSEGVRVRNSKEFRMRNKCSMFKAVRSKRKACKIKARTMRLIGSEGLNKGQHSTKSNEPRLTALLDN